MTYVAWDIETCPLPYDSLSDTHQERHESEVGRLRERNPDLTGEELSRRASSFHPHLGWICCISAVRGTENDMADPKSWTASSPDEEEGLLDQFWADVHSIGCLVEQRGDQVQWVTFNGKDYDVPFLTARTVASGLAPTRKDIINTYPFDHEPHADLQGLWPNSHYSLDDLCSFLDVESPKGEVDGSQVAELTRDGKIEKVARYCEGDVVATLRCAQKVSALL